MAADCELRGETRAYRLNFGTNTACRLEAMLGDKPYAEVLRQLAAPDCSVRLLRTFIQAALIDPKPESEAEVGDIIDDIGGMQIVKAALIGATEDHA